MTDDASKVPTAKVGNLTADPELRFGKSGVAFTTFGLAYRPYVPKGEPEVETTFYQVICFGSLAEHVAQCVAKGDRVVVAGHGELHHWKDSDGQERVDKRIVAEGVGPDLRFVTAQIERTERQSASTPVASTGGYRADDEPF